MAEMIPYLLKVSVCMVLLYGLYVLTLKKETHFHFNRIYLLFSIIISMVIPLLNIYNHSSTSASGLNYITQTVQVSSDHVFETRNGIAFFHYIYLIYLSVVMILWVRFIIKLVSIILIRRHSQIEQQKGFNLALSNKQIAPFSFFYTIYMNEETINDAHLDKIINHETVHIRQFHSFDIVFAEIICMLTWFNPVSYLIKAALKETHEYLADSGVSEQTPDSAEYLLLLIKNAIGVQPGLANNFNKSLTLKRLNMMKKTRSGRFSKLKALLALPVLFLLVLTFSCKNKAAESKSQNPSMTEKKSDTTVDKLPEFPGGQAALVKFITDQVKYPEAAKKSGIEGKVAVSFVVTKTGKIDKIRVNQKVNDLLDAEAIRVVSMMPDWIPGENKGIAVDVETTLPIAFKLADKK